MKRPGLGVEYQGSGCARGGQMPQDAKRAASNASGHASQRPDALDTTLPLPDGISPGERTQNRSLPYNLLERPAHGVSQERQNTRYFFC